jgi:membrane protein DedA with SNARE-associated domain
LILLPPGEFQHLISSYGSWVIAGVVALEGIGVPVPGETTLLAAAIYAGTSDDLSIWSVIAAAALGAIAGDNIGFLLGREAGYRLLRRFGHYVGFTDRRIKLGQFLFRRHGGKVVFFGRFVALLRALAPFLAGTNRMTWRRFAMFNAAGGCLWAGLYGLGGFYLGNEVERMARPVGIAIGVAATFVVILGILLLRRHGAKLADEAERAIPGPLVGRDAR